MYSSLLGDHAKSCHSLDMLMFKTFGAALAIVAALLPATAQRRWCWDDLIGARHFEKELFFSSSEFCATSFFKDLAPCPTTTTTTTTTTTATTTTEPPYVYLPFTER